ncbi:MAG: HAD family phosphatase [Acidobacteria bacterium]|nr:HAD family phosphatase [Acidobacteriota bacterium]MBS1865736.1 HAD family phosphatase [Acidobacteriota bacterium]
MAASQIKTIIFDIGRVLVRVDVSRAMQGLAQGISLSPQELWTAIEKDPRWPDWQEGRISARDWHLHLTKRLGSSLSFDQFAEAWNRALDPQPIQDNALFESLRKNFRLGLLSNTDSIHVAHLEATYDFFRFFPKSARTYSCSVGSSKPSPLIFRDALKALRSKAEESVFIDDIRDYVEAARTLGMKGIHYQDPVQLRQELNALGANLPV